MPRIHDEEGHTDLLWIYVPAVLIGAAALFITYQFVDPAPPSRITIASGGPGGAYYAYAERYRESLARQGVVLDVRQTQGSLETLVVLNLNFQTDHAPLMDPSDRMYRKPTRIRQP